MQNMANGITHHISWGILSIGQALYVEIAEVDPEKKSGPKSYLALVAEECIAAYKTKFSQ